MKTMKTMKTILYSLTAICLTTLIAFAPADGDLTSKNVHVNFYSHTDIEDIKADNYKAVSKINTTTGKVIFSIPMQSFEFEKAMMQKHFNSSKFLNTQKYPKAKLIGNISNLSDIDFKKDGVYNAEVTGKLTIKDVTKEVKEKGTVTVKGGVVTIDTKINLFLADYNVVFTKGKPAASIAKTVAATVKAVY